MAAMEKTDFCWCKTNPEDRLPSGMVLLHSPRKGTPRTWAWKFCPACGKILNDRQLSLIARRAGIQEAKRIAVQG